MTAASGDWRLWRGNPQRTGLQGVPGRIERPQIMWRQPLGGLLTAGQVLNLSGTLDPAFYTSTGGRTEAFSADASLRWNRRLGATLRLLGAWDLFNDGRLQIIAASPGLSNTSLYALDAVTGEILWKTSPEPGQVGSVKVVNLGISRGRQIIWLPAASSTIRLYAFPETVESKLPYWSTTLDNFVSDPYTFSSIAVASLDGGGPPSIVVAGARSQVPTIILEARSGRERGRISYEARVHGLESGGAGQLLELVDMDGDGQKSILQVSSYGSAASYMFQGVILSDIGGADRILDTFPVGPRFVDGAVQFLGSDPIAKIVLSLFDPGERRHDLVILDGRTLVEKARFPDFYLEAILGKEPDGRLSVLGHRGIQVENPGVAPYGPLAKLSFDGTGFSLGWTSPSASLLATYGEDAFDQEAVENPGAKAMILNRREGPAVLVLMATSDSSRTALAALDFADGKAVALWDPGAGRGLSLVRTSSSPPSRVLVQTDDGLVTMLDEKLDEVARVPVGHYDPYPVNGHATERAIVADLDGKGRPTIVAEDARSQLLRLDVRWNYGRAAISANPIWSCCFGQEPTAVPLPEGGSGLIVRGLEGFQPFLASIDGSGRELWRHVFGGPLGDPVEDASPVGLNFGKLSEGGHFDLLVSGGASNALPQTSYALDGVSGEVLWSSPVGGYWDGAIAVADLDDDGFDDAVLNANLSKANAAHGIDGARLSDGAVLPIYQDLSFVDYNGAPVIVGRLGPETLVLNAEDDGHMALLGIPQSGCEPCTTRVIWSRPQTTSDDERYSMPSLAPIEGKILAGVGSRRGVLTAVNVLDGTTVWQSWLRKGAVTEPTEDENSLGSVISMDVDGDGRLDFVVGGSDGWLYAVDAGSGRLTWSLDLGAAVGDPIGADYRGLGFSEILVSTQDGYLNAIGQAPPLPSPNPLPPPPVRRH